MCQFVVICVSVAVANTMTVIESFYSWIYYTYMYQGILYYVLNNWYPLVQRVCLAAEPPTFIIATHRYLPSRAKGQVAVAYADTC